MNERPTPEEQKIIDDCARMVAADLEAGLSRAKIIEKLERQGWPYEEASGFVYNIEHSYREYLETPEGMSRVYFGYMIAGIIAVILGLAVTLGTYSISDSIGGFFLVAWGAVVFGAIAFVRGLIGWLWNRL